MESINPFGSDELRNQILAKEGRLDFDDQSQENDDLMGIISSAPAIPKSAKNVILDSKAMAIANRKEKEGEIAVALTDMLTDLNEQYDLNLDGININNFTQTLVNVIDPQKREILELYVSEISRSIKPVLYLHILQRLILVMDNVLSPEVLFSNEFSAPDKVLLLEKIVAMAGELSDALEEMKVDNSDAILKKLAEERNDSNLDSPESKKMIEEFMAMFKKDNGV